MDELSNRRFLYAQFTTEGVRCSNTSKLLTSSVAVLKLVEKQTHHYPLVTVETTMFTTCLDMLPVTVFFSKKKKMDHKHFSWKFQKKYFGESL